jgi:hypothetical protein
MSPLDVSPVARYPVYQELHSPWDSSGKLPIQGHITMAQFDDDGQFEDEDQDSGRGSSKPRKQKVQAAGTNWGKVILILCGVGAVSLALCCGVGYYFFSKAFKMETDPVKIAVMQKEIVEIDIPADMQPAMGMNMNLGVMTMKIVAYNPNQSSTLMLMQMQVTGQTDEQMQQSFRQQAGQQQNAQFRIESSETKTVKINGEDRDFLFAKGTITPPGGAAAIPARMITGMFPAKTGMGFIQYSIDETKYDEAAVIKTLESIHK